MVLQSSGQISNSNLAVEFGVPFTSAISMSNYYKGGTYVPNVASHSNVPTSGQISLSKFYGTSKAAAAQVNLFSLANVTGLTNLYTARTGVTLTNGKVSSWDDQAGFSRTLTQATVASQPTLLSTDINGYPAVSFGGTTGVMLRGIGGGSSSVVLHAFVMNASSKGYYSQFLSSSPVSTSSYNAGSVHGLWGNFTGSPCQVSVANNINQVSTYNAPGTSVLVVYIIDNITKSSVIRINGTVVSTAVVPTAQVNPDISYIDVGGWFGETTRTLNGSLGEVALYGRGTSFGTTEIESIEGYLSHRWWGAGALNTLPSGHTYKASPPTIYSQIPTNYKYALLTSALSSQANASAVSIWGTYRQTNATYRPKYYTSGGYNNKPFVRFTSAVPTQLLNSVQASYRFDLGFTLMFLMKHTEAGTVNKNGYARFTSIMFPGGYYTEFCRNGSTNDLQFFIYYKNTSGTNSYIIANTSGNTGIVTNQWVLYACRFRNDTNVIEIKSIQLPTVKTSISSISEFTTIASSTNTPVLIASVNANANQDSMCSYIGTADYVPAHDFGGGFVFDRVVTDDDLVGAANYLLSA